MGWFGLWSRPKPDLETKIIEFGRTRFDDIEDDIKGLKSSLQTFVEDTEKALRKLKERVGSLEEKGEWKPRLGDRVRFKHSFFGEMEGIFLEAVFPERPRHPRKQRSDCLAGKSTGFRQRTGHQAYRCLQFLRKVSSPYARCCLALTGRLPLRSLGPSWRSPLL